MIKLIVLDRDGALGQVPEDFVHSAEDWAPQPGALEAVARLNHGGWRVVIASNQSGIGRGLFDMATLNAIHARMHKLLAGAGECAPGGRIVGLEFARGLEVTDRVGNAIEFEQRAAERERTGGELLAEVPDRHERRRPEDQGDRDRGHR